MKRAHFPLSAAAVSALLALAAVQALAADAGPAAGTPPPGDRPMSAADAGNSGARDMDRHKGGCRLMRMDKNGDGKVSRQEFMQGHAAMFDRMDSNGDNMLDPQEHRAFKAEMKQERSGKCGQGKGEKPAPGGRQTGE